MREYPDQPKVATLPALDFINDVIKDVLERELPECEVNNWFLDSVEFANMIDTMVEEIKREIIT